MSGRRPGRPKGTQKPQATEAEMEIRRAWVEAKMLAGWSDGRTGRAAAKEFDVTARQGGAYVRQVRLHWKESSNSRAASTPEERYTEHRARMLNLFSRASDAGEIRAAIAAAERLGQLDGFWTTTKVHISGTVQHQNDADYLRQLDEVLAGAGYVRPETNAPVN